MYLASVRSDQRLALNTFDDPAKRFSVPNFSCQNVARRKICIILYTHIYKKRKIYTIIMDDDKFDLYGVSQIPPLFWFSG